MNQINHMNDINCNCNACCLTRQKQSVLGLTSADANLLCGLGSVSVDYEQRQRLYKNEEYKKTQEEIQKYKDWIEIEKSKADLIILKEKFNDIVLKNIGYTE